MAPQKRVCIRPTLSLRSSPRLSRASVSSRLSRSPAPRRDQVGEHGGDAELIGRIVDAAGRHQEIERRRAHVLHALGQQGQSIGERVLINFGLHFYLISQVLSCEL